MAKTARIANRTDSTTSRRDWTAAKEFRREHALEYKRLVESGQLSKYLVDAPTEPMKLGSRILGFSLIAFRLVLLVFVIRGWIGSMLSG